MISWIKGELVSSWQANNKFYILVNCQGLGYEIQTLESVILEINTNKITEKDIILWLKHIKKEDSDMLFGFNSKEQRDFFIQILNIKGIGSQIGMSLLNKFSLNQLITAISNNDKKSISTVQGIGQKMTERIILELKSKVINKEIENLLRLISQFSSKLGNEKFINGAPEAIVDNEKEKLASTESTLKDLEQQLVKISNL